MKQLLQRAWRATRVLLGRGDQVEPRPGNPDGDAVERVPTWSREDAALWGGVISSDVGKRLMARFLAVEFDNYRRQCADPMHAAHSAGRARGFTDAREWLESLSRVTGAQVTNGPAGPDIGQTDSPRAEGEPDLAERYSP